MLKLVFFVPESHCEQVKSAVFAAGAGRQGDYQHCAWQTLGQGQFMPLSGSQPFLGQTDKLSTVSEYRVEMLCQEQSIKEVIAALKQAHPYEEPAYDVIQLVDC